MIKAALQSRPYVIIEFLLLCIAVPGWIILTRNAPMMMIFLWSAFTYCAVIYALCFFDKARGNFSRNVLHLWNWKAVNADAMKPMLKRFAMASVGMVIFLYFYNPDRLFYLPLQKPEFVPFLLAFYPVFSALPQEFIFCSFFFLRYARYFGSGRGMIASSTIIFAYVHVLYINPVAPTLSLIGGYIFAQTFMKSKSLALVTIEHGLYGNMLFLTGLGWYFYSGGVGAG
jgi:membrane protease YdiL (CAAX protease family)